MVAHTLGQTVRVLLVDDHPLVRTGFAELISREPDLTVCGEAGSAAEAMRLVRGHAPDLALIDLRLKDSDGLALCTQLASIRPELRMLVVSMQDELLYAERTLQAGAHGFVSKDSAQAQLLDAMRTVMSGKRWLSPTMSDRVLSRVRRRRSAGSPIEALSERESKVLKLIGTGLTTKEIAAELGIRPKTVESYRENLKRKLNLESGLELTRYAIHRVLENN